MPDLGPVPSSSALTALVARPSSSVLVMDFDGVLSPIVDDPAESRLAPGVAENLERVAARLEVVALLSGRPLAFLRDRATIPGVRLLGSYGVEELRDGAQHVHGGVDEWLAVVKQTREELLERFATEPGIRVEDKLISVAVHWRLAENHAAAGALVHEVTGRVAAATGLHREPGKLVEELRPPLDRDKGVALRELAAELADPVVAYAGDDRGDLPAFAAADDLGGHLLVVDHGAETAAELRAVDGERFAGVEGFNAWLHALADAL